VIVLLFAMAGMALLAGSRGSGAPLWPIEMGPMLDLVLILLTLAALFVRSRSDGDLRRGVSLSLAFGWALAGFVFALNVGDGMVMLPYAVPAIAFGARASAGRHRPAVDPA
jgi:hypothetical protein